MGGGLWGQEGFTEGMTGGMACEAESDVREGNGEGMPGLDMAKAKVPGPEWLVRLERRLAIVRQDEQERQRQLAKEREGCAPSLFSALLAARTRNGVSSLTRVFGNQDLGWQSEGQWPGARDTVWEVMATAFVCMGARLAW